MFLLSFNVILYGKIIANIIVFRCFLYVYCLQLSQ